MRKQYGKHGGHGGQVSHFTRMGAMGVKSPISPERTAGRVKGKWHGSDVPQTVDKDSGRAAWFVEMMSASDRHARQFTSEKRDLTPADR